MSAQPASWLALAGTLLLVAMVFVWRPLLQRRRHGTWGLVLFEGSVAQKVRDVMLFALPVLLIGQAVVATQSPHALGLSEADLRAPAFLRSTLGTLLMYGGLLFQGASMLDRARPGLATEGFYRYTRNPIFLALIAVLVGYMLLIPTLLSALILAAAVFAIRQQIAAEEAHLLRTYGDSYRRYAGRVGRLLPGIGRLG